MRSPTILPILTSDPQLLCWVCKPWSCRSRSREAAGSAGIFPQKKKSFGEQPDSSYRCDYCNSLGGSCWRTRLLKLRVDEDRVCDDSQLAAPRTRPCRNRTEKPSIEGTSCGYWTCNSSIQPSILGEHTGQSSAQWFVWIRWSCRLRTAVC